LLQGGLVVEHDVVCVLKDLHSEARGSMPGDVTVHEPDTCCKSE
jgi:hypothetical protein